MDVVSISPPDHFSPAGGIFPKSLETGVSRNPAESANVRSLPSGQTFENAGPSRLVHGPSGRLDWPAEQGTWEERSMKHAYVPRTTNYTLNPGDDLNDLRMSDQVRPLYDHVRKFIRETVEPMSVEFYRLGEKKTDRWSFTDGQLEVLGKSKSKAKEEGLWNFFLPDAETGEGLKNLDYAYIAAELGKSPLASETMNCAAPDTGNMEVLERVGTPEQKKQWLEPLLEGKIRSAYCMTELNTASSDAKNIDTRATRVGDEYVINGEKHYISGAGDPRCKVMIAMVRTREENAPPHLQQAQILVPLPTEGVKIVGGQQVFGDPDAPHGHMHII